MSGILSIAVSGLNSAAQRFANATSSIVNASSTGGSGDVTPALVSTIADKTDYAANAAVVKTVEKTDKALLDIIA
jgi:hypothetical protein